MNFSFYTQWTIIQKAIIIHNHNLASGLSKVRSGGLGAVPWLCGYGVLTVAAEPALHAILLSAALKPEFVQVLGYSVSAFQALVPVRCSLYALGILPHTPKHVTQSLTGAEKAACVVGHETAAVGTQAVLKKDGLDWPWTTMITSQRVDDHYEILLPYPEEAWVDDALVAHKRGK